MKRYAILIALIMVGSILMLYPYAVDNARKANNLSQYLDSSITKSISRSYMMASLFNHSNRQGAHEKAQSAIQQAIILNKYRNELVEEMIQAKLGKNPQLIQWYLDKRISEIRQMPEPIESDALARLNK